MIYLLKTALRLFGGGENGGPSPSAAAAAPGTPVSRAEAQSEAQGETQRVPGNTRRGETGDGQSAPQAAAAEEKEGASSAPDPMEEKRKAFRELVRGEYRDVYTEETQKMINKRFREAAELRARLDGIRPLIEALYPRRGARDEGETAELPDAPERDAIRGKAESWIREAEEVRERFPAFDLAREIEDPAFMALLRSGAPVEQAYKAAHFDELISSAVNAAAAEARAAVVENVRARGARPQENGAGSRSAFTLRDDVSKLTREERADMARRAARGEIISF